MENYKKVEPASPFAFPIAKAGLPFVGIAAFATAVFALLGITVLALTGLVATFFIGYFFRDPDRVIPDRDGAVVSPADGKVIKVESVEKGRFCSGSCLKISIFMSIFNVHVNRIPSNGEIVRVAYFPGKFFSANLDKASSDNEHNALFLKTDKGREICFVQIAGLVARRIICNVQEGQSVVRGQRFGLICFGSRLDVYLPADTEVSVKVGDRVSAGTTVLGELPI
ncbi:MAG: phosphatidylserine decarboxylase family protein [Deltaproteobacteria bacterium]|nr:phosphatidylserine decarboxylase family protein [Deltaproteobacteria bacterium]MBW2176665.1 phosphatidylserine decarboxylase family protein [Deltaproteobacteria bacterium]MBW2297190.1 phosphatidylserine decarboxylase family protein [Deltaproteobacteria bacterium]